jgi:hypothetical protein
MPPPARPHTALRGQPVDESFYVRSDKMRDEGDSWCAEGNELGHVAREAEQLRIRPEDAAIFDFVMSAYEQTVTQLASWCRQGDDRMQELSELLHSIAGKYDRLDLEAKLAFDRVGRNGQ